MPLPPPPPVSTATPNVAALAQIITGEPAKAGSSSDDQMLLHLPLSLSLLLPKQTLDLCVRMEVKIPTDLLLVDPKE